MLRSHNFRTGYIHHPKPLVLGWACAFLALFSSQVFAQNLIKNGDFEVPPFAPSSDVTDWVVGGTGHVHSINEGATSPTHSAALNIGHNSEGTTISQSFPTVVGQTYRVDFDSAVFGTPSGGPLQLNVRIVGNGTLLDKTVTPRAALTFDPAEVIFTHSYYTFTANSTTSTIQFTDVGLGNESADVVIDTVSVQPEENILTNGDFEDPPFDTPGTVSGWAVGGSGQIVDRSAEGSVGGSHGAAFSAGGDSSGNVLTQTFATTVGKIYALEFFTGVFGVPDNGAPAPQLQVKVLGSDTAIDDTVTPPLESTFDPALVRFQRYNYTFVADSPMTTLMFTDIGTGNVFSDVILDTVSVMAEPAELLNGDFETGPFDMFTVTGWQISGTGRIESKSEGWTTPNHSAAFSTGGSSQGSVLSQTIATVAGRQYHLAFDSGIFGVRSGPRLQMQVRAIGNGTILNQTITPPEALTYDPNLVTFQHYGFMFTANSGSSTLQFQDVGTGNSAADALIDTVLLQLQPRRTFAYWQTTVFNQAQLDNPGISGWGADPDGDAIENGLEYFLNTNPLKGTSTVEAAMLPRISITTSGPSRYLTLTYRRPIEWDGTPEIIAVSDDLVTWDETEQQIEQVGVPSLTGDGFSETVTVRLTTPINQGPILRKFLRLGLNQ